MTEDELKAKIVDIIDSHMWLSEQVAHHMRHEESINIASQIVHLIKDELTAAEDRGYGEAWKG